MKEHNKEDLEAALQLLAAYFRAPRKVQDDPEKLLPVLREAAKKVSHVYNASHIWTQLVGLDIRDAKHRYCRPVGVTLTKFDKAGDEFNVKLPGRLKPR